MIVRSTSCTVEIGGSPRPAATGAVHRYSTDRHSADRRLRLLSLRDRADGELLTRPSVFLAVDGVGAQVTSETDGRIEFAAAGVTGTLVVELDSGATGTRLAGSDSGADPPRFVVTLTSPAARTLRLDVGYVRTAAEPDTVWFNPRNGGGLVHRRESYDAVYPGEGSVCAIFSHRTRATDAGAGAGPVLGFFNEEQRRIRLAADIAPDESVLSASFEELELPAGVPLRLPALYLSVAESWEDALEPYRRWLQSVYRPRTDTPEWVADPGWHFFTVRISSFRDEEIEELRKELDRGLAICREVGATPLVWLGHWWSRCREMRGRWYFDHVQGDFLQVPQATRPAIEHCHANGAKVLVYLNITAIGELSETFHAEDGKLLLDRHGAPVRNAEYPMAMLCPAARGTRAYWLTVIDFLFGELDIDGVFLDQAGGGYRAPYCYASDHGHDEIDVYGRGMLELLSAVRERIHEHNSEAIIVGELAHDLRTRYIDWWLWHWNWGRIHDRSGYGETLIWMRSLCPDARFVEQEASRAAPLGRALEMAGRGIWINATYMPPAFRSGASGDEPARPPQPDYHETIWQAQRRHAAVLTSVPRMIRTATDAESARCAALLFSDPSAPSRAVVSLLHPDEGDHYVELYLPGRYRDHRATAWPHGLGSGRLVVLADQPPTSAYGRVVREPGEASVARARFRGRAAIFLLQR